MPDNLCNEYLIEYHFDQNISLLLIIKTPIEVTIECCTEIGYNALYLRYLGF